MRGWAWQAIIGTVVGIALGVLVGWQVWPVSYTNTAPDVLRQDYRDDYVVMVATAYAVNQDLPDARRRLQLVDAQEPEALVVDLAERTIEANGDRDDIIRLARLAQALGQTSSPLMPYLERTP
jgi:hypothetical protein